jgi:hypothetical protein
MQMRPGCACLYDAGSWQSDDTLDLTRSGGSLCCIALAPVGLVLVLVDY